MAALLFVVSPGNGRPQLHVDLAPKRKEGAAEESRGPRAIA